MPLNGEIIQSGNRQICATKSGPPPLPPETFGIDFMRNFWASLNANDQANVEGAVPVFVTPHWGPPGAPPSDLSAVATPIDFPDEVFSSLQSRTARIEFEVPKSDFEKLGWQAAHLPNSIPPDANPNMPLKLRGWYFKGVGLSKEESGDDSRRGEKQQSEIKHPLIIMSSGFPYSITYTNPVGGINVGRQMRKTITYLVASGYDVLFFDKRGHGYSQGLLDGMARTFFALSISLIAA
jgi:pimeloyl-ACP methyl ester carboxylesterase